MVRLFDTQADGESVSEFEGKRASVLEELAIRREMPVIGRFVNGRYHHDLTGTEFTLSPDWRITYQAPSSGGGQQVGFINRGLRMEAFVWMKRQDVPGFLMLPETAEHRLVDGKQALSVESEYYRGNDRMVEYYTWVKSEK